MSGTSVLLNINLHISTSSARYINSLLHRTVASNLVLPNMCIRFGVWFTVSYWCCLGSGCVQKKVFGDCGPCNAN